MPVDETEIRKLVYQHDVDISYLKQKDLTQNGCIISIEQKIDATYKLMFDMREDINDKLDKKLSMWLKVAFTLIAGTFIALIGVIIDLAAH